MAGFEDFGGLFRSAAQGMRESGLPHSGQNIAGSRTAAPHDEQTK